jgi:hypothetical protein
LFFSNYSIDEINDDSGNKGKGTHKGHPHHGLLTVGKLDIVLIHQINDTPKDEQTENDGRHGITQGLVFALNVGELAAMPEDAQHSE